MVLIAMEPEVRFEAMRGWQVGADVEFRGAEGARRGHQPTVAWVKLHLMGLKINDEWSAGAAGSGGLSEQQDAALERIICAPGPASAGSGGDFEVGVAADGGHYLRDRALAEPPAAVAAEKGGRGEEPRPRVVVAFFPETKRDEVNLLGEAQDLGTFFGRRPELWAWEANPRPTSETFETAMINVYGRRAIVHFAGHCDASGALQWVRDRSGRENSGLDANSTVDVLKVAVEAGGVDCAVLNSCNTFVLAQRLRREAGVPNVACWQGEVEDALATVFSSSFYQSLEKAPGDYHLAVETGKVKVRNVKRREFVAGRPVPRGRLCLLSDSERGDIEPGDGEDGCEWSASGDEDTRDEFGDEEDGGSDVDVGGRSSPAGDDQREDGAAGREPVRSATNRQGSWEREGFKVLGFKLDVGQKRLSIEAGIRLYEESGVTQPDARLSNGVPLRDYGLKESKRDLRPRRKHLYYERWALRKVFKSATISCYEDVFVEQGPLETRVETLEEQSQGGDAKSRQELQQAVRSFRDALETRQKQLEAAERRGDADASHRRMVSELMRLVRRIKEAAAPPRAVPAGAAGAGLEGSVGGMSIDDGSKGGAWQEARRKR